MKIPSIVKKPKIDLYKKIRSLKKIKKMKIMDLDEDSKVVSVDQIGLGPLGDGIVILKSDDDLKFPISSFSADTAKSISDFKTGNRNEMPSVYNMIENICENSGLILVKVRIYENGKALRANLYFSGKKDLVLRNHRASDAIALATFYSIPILIKKDLLKQSPKIDF